MRRLLSCLLASVVALLLGTSAAPACINDSEAVTHEQQFKENYLRPKEFKSNYLQQPAPSSAPGSTPRDVALSGVGVALLAGAVVVGLRVAGRR